MMGKKFITIIIFMIIILTPAAYAAESTPSADIKAKLEELKKEITSKAAKLKQEVEGKLKNKAYIGKVKTKSETTITLATKNGPRIVNTNEDSQFEGKVRGKKLSQKLLAEEDYLAALGDVDDQQVLSSRKIILLPVTNESPKTFLWGQIVAISDKLVTIKGRNLKNTAVSVSNPSLVKLNDFVILTGSLGKNDIFETQFVYVIPQGGILKPKRKIN